MPPPAPFRRVFHTMEKLSRIFPRNGKTFADFSTVWKILAPALLLAAAPVRAALPEPPPLPFPLPAADLLVRRSTTLYTPGQYLHVALLDRPLAGYELDDLSAALARLNWKPQVADSAREISALRDLQVLAPTPELRQPFDATLQLLQDGLKSWTLDAIQLLYTPGENASLCLTFPLPPDAIPSSAGSFTADLPLPLHDATFSQAAIQAEPAQITRMETWLSRTPPELFLSQAEPPLLAAGWLPPDPPAPPAVQPGSQSARAQVLFMEATLKSAFRVYHRGTSQLTVFRVPSDPSGPGAPPHAYPFVLRTLLQWPLPPTPGNKP